MAFTINGNLVFIDRMQFMNPSLDLLSDFRYLSQELSGEFLDLIKQKEVYPYEYMDSCEKFFSSPKDKCISEKDYLKVNDILNWFEINTVGNHYDLYSKTDVLLSADVFEKFVST